MNTPVLAIADIGSTIDYWKNMGIAAVGAAAVFVLVIAVLAGRKGNATKTWNISLATLIPLVIIGGAIGIGVIVFGQQLSQALHIV